MTLQEIETILNKTMNSQEGVFEQENASKLILASHLISQIELVNRIYHAKDTDKELYKIKEELESQLNTLTK